MNARRASSSCASWSRIRSKARGELAELVVVRSTTGSLKSPPAIRSAAVLQPPDPPGERRSEAPNPTRIEMQQRDETRPESRDPTRLSLASVSRSELEKRRTLPLLSGIATSAYEVPSRPTRPRCSVPVVDARSATGSLRTSAEKPKRSESLRTSIVVCAPPAIGWRNTTRATGGVGGVVDEVLVDPGGVAPPSRAPSPTGSAARSCR